MDARGPGYAISDQPGLDVVMTHIFGGGFLGGRRGRLGLSSGRGALDGDSECEMTHGHKILIPQRAGRADGLAVDESTVAATQVFYGDLVGRNAKLRVLAAH